MFCRLVLCGRRFILISIGNLFSFLDDRLAMLSFSRCLSCTILLANRCIDFVLNVFCTLRMWHLLLFWLLFRLNWWFIFLFFHYWCFVLLFFLLYGFSLLLYTLLWLFNLFNLSLRHLILLWLNLGRLLWRLFFLLSLFLRWCWLWFFLLFFSLRLHNILFWLSLGFVLRDILVLKGSHSCIVNHIVFSSKKFSITYF